EFAEVDLGIEIGREIVPVATGVDIDDVDIADAVEILIHGDSRVSIDHARVEADTENRRDVIRLAQLAALPLVVGIPRWRFADLVRDFVNTGIKVGGTVLDASLQYRHIDKRR